MKSRAHKVVKSPTLKDQLPRRERSSRIDSQSFIGQVPEGFSDRMNFLDENANFEKKTLYVRDGVTLYYFVRHEGYDRAGNLLPNDGSALPEAQLKQKLKE